MLKGGNLTEEEEHQGHMYGYCGGPNSMIVSEILL